MTSVASCSSVVVTSDSLNLDQLIDVIIATETHEEYVSFNVNATDGAFPDGWVPKTHAILDMANVDAAITPLHNSLLVWNNSVVDPLFTDAWIDRPVISLIEGLTVTVEGLLAIQNSKIIGRSGNPGLTDMVAFTGTLVNGFTCGMGSAGDNNAVYKREPTDTDFVYLQTLSKGEIANFDLPAGTVFRSTKGIMGFSSPFPHPFGVSSLSDIYFRFYVFRRTNVVNVTSAGLESIVNLYAADGVTLVDGPITIEPFGSTQMECGTDATGEFVIDASTDVYCSTQTIDDRDHRIVPPMALEFMVWNRLCRVTAQETNTEVTWYRRGPLTNDLGTFIVDAGTPVNIYNGTRNTGPGELNAGNTTDYGIDGCLILRSDKPISGFSGADGNGGEATPGWPLDQMAQLFPNPANIDDDADRGRSSVTIGSQYEGTMFVYDSTQTLITSVAITRPTAVVVASDQLYPAAAQWAPVDSGLVDWNGGYVETNVPCVCIMNMNGSPSPWNADGGDELNIVGTTPEDIRAVIRIDADGFKRRRDVDNLGVETWNIC